jgi:iron complex outermembrane receptor protein
LGASSIGLLTDAQPRNKGLLNAQLDWRHWRFVADVAKFGTHRIPTATTVQTIDGSTSLDLSAAYRLTRVLTILGGVLNATNEYPGRIPGEGTGRPYSEADPLGFNGREYYLRLTAEF